MAETVEGVQLNKSAAGASSAQKRAGFAKACRQTEDELSNPLDLLVLTEMGPKTQSMSLNIRTPIR